MLVTARQSTQSLHVDQRRERSEPLSCLYHDVGSQSRVPLEVIADASPKSGRDPKIPVTKRLAVALKAARPLRSELVFCYADGKPLTRSAIKAALRYGCKLSSPIRMPTS